MKRLILLIIFFTVFSNISFASDIKSFYIKEAPIPNKNVFSAANQAIEQFKDKFLFTDECRLNINPEHGIIETNWHRVHKGEVCQKIQIFVWGNLCRVDVWDKPYLGIFKRPYKSYMSRLTEMHTQTLIDNILTSNKIVSPDH